MRVKQLSMWNIGIHLRISTKKYSIKEIFLTPTRTENSVFLDSINMAIKLFKLSKTIKSCE